MTKDQRKEKGERTKLEILEQALILARKDGLGRLTIKQIAEAISMSDAGILKPFGSKKDLQCQLIDYAFDKYDKIIFEAEPNNISPRTRLVEGLRKWLTTIANDYENGGCFICAITMEYRHQQDTVGHRVSKRMEQLLKKVEKLIDKCIKKQELPKHVIPSQLALTLFNHILVTNWRMQCLWDEDCVDEADSQILELVKAFGKKD